MPKATLKDWSAGILDDVTVELTNCRYVKWDYGKPNEYDAETFFFAKCIDQDDGSEFEQRWKCGAGWYPSADGESEADEGDELWSDSKTTLSKKSNIYRFIRSLIDAGFDPDLIDGNASTFEGMVVHMIQEPIGGTKIVDGEERPMTTPVVDEIISMPGEGGGRKPKGGQKKDASKPKTTAEKESKTAGEKEPAAEEKGGGDEGDVRSEAISAVLEVLEDKSTVKINKLPGEVHKACKGNPNRDAIVKMVFEDKEFLADGPWEYDADKKTVSAE